jgi:hypothetical protein
MNQLVFTISEKPLFKRIPHIVSNNNIRIFTTTSEFKNSDYRTINGTQKCIIYQATKAANSVSNTMLPLLNDHSIPTFDSRPLFRKDPNSYLTRPVGKIGNYEMLL